MVAAPDTLRAPLAPRIALAIPHLPGDEKRDAAFLRLLEQLDAVPPTFGDAKELHLLEGDHPFVAARAFTERARNEEWSETMWRWGVEQNATHFLQLQDDVMVAPNFWPVLHAMLDALPGEVICLETAMPEAPALCADHARWCTTADAVIGPGYLLPRELLEEFLAWRERALVDGWRTGGAGGRTALTEDTMIGIWCMCTGRKVWLPIPTIIDHDTSLASTYGNEAHANRRPTVLWSDAQRFGEAWKPEDLEIGNFWRGQFERIPHTAPDGTFLGMQRADNMQPDPVRHLGRFYEATPHLARAWVKGFGERAFSRARADNGDLDRRRLKYAQQARGSYRSKERILICTPTRSGVHPEHMAGVVDTVRLLEADLENGFELLDAWRWHEDVVRVRSRFLRAARETDCTAVHFRDADVGAGGLVLLGMLQTGHALVASPYPRRDGFNWTGVRRAIADGLPPESLAYNYGVGLQAGKPFEVDRTGCVPVDWMPLGCSIVRRECFERMIDHYAELDEKRVDLSIFDETHGVHLELGRLSRGKLEKLAKELALEVVRWRAGAMGLRYEDKVGDQSFPTTGVFQLLTRAMRPGGPAHLLGEDQSFCVRWRDLGEKVHMYLGPGSPVNHATEYTFRGHLEAFGIRRLSPAEARAWAEERNKRRAEEFALDAPEDPAREPEEPGTP